MIGSVGFSLAAIGILRGTVRPVPRIILALAFGAAAFVSLAVGIGTLAALRENDANPTVESMVARLRACATQPDRAAILTKLRGAGFEVNPSSGPYAANSDSVYLPPWAIAQSASSISFVTDRVRSDTATTISSDRLAVVFLFDSKDQLLTWSYDLFSIAP
ncbi:hypothetical protein BH09VER1_BH09VER1_44010 [soil metagenome]